MNLKEQLELAANKLAKWRSVFAGWQLGTRLKSDPESNAVRDHREVTMMLRAEVNALTKILLDKRVCSPEELQQAILEEVEYLDKAYEHKFPGMRTTESGVDYYDLPLAQKTMKGWRP